MYKNAWVVAVDMGYGHQRAAYPLRHLSPTGKVLIANNYEGIPSKDRAIWENSRRFYEFVSRLTNIPFIGKKIFNWYDKLQAIPEFYPRRDLSAPNFQLKQMYKLIKRGWGKDLIKNLNKEDIPLVTTFFVSAFMAEEHGFKNDIYCVLCDADISRTWVGLVPKKSRIKFLAPCRRVMERLKLYGVKEENIFLTGFPLPEENLGGPNLKTLKNDLLERIINLDPEHRYRQKYLSTVKDFLGPVDRASKHEHPLTITFAVGGAGAQKKLGIKIIDSLKKKIVNGEVNLNLVAGSRDDVYLYFKNKIVEEGMDGLLGKNIRIIYSANKEDYFRILNDHLRTSDVLWTKPSELVFYAALGLPIIMASPIGSQEFFNRIWLKTIGGGISQNDPRHTSEWFFDWVKSGWLAEAAMSAYLDGRQFGVYNINDVVLKGVKKIKSYQLL